MAHVCMWYSASSCKFVLPFHSLANLLGSLYGRPNMIGVTRAHNSTNTNRIYVGIGSGGSTRVHTHTGAHARECLRLHV
jgi:hypothetical protein